MPVGVPYGATPAIHPSPPLPTSGSRPGSNARSRPIGELAPAPNERHRAVMRPAHRIFRGIAAAALLACASCSAERRPEQKNFKLYTNGQSPDEVQTLARETAAALSLKISAATFLMEGGALSRHLELYGHGFSIFIQSAPDQQCYTPDRQPISFHRGIYDVTVARTGLSLGHSRITELSAVLAETAKRHGTILTDKPVRCPGGGDV